MSNVFLHVKCEVELDTDLAVDEAMEMEEAEIYEMFAEKFKQKALDTFAKQFKKIKKQFRKNDRDVDPYLNAHNMQYSEDSLSYQKRKMAEECGFQVNLGFLYEE
jgi:predicted Mrr-cat superfamily restriction endonuclease